MIDTLYVNGCSWTFGDELQLDHEFNKWLKTLNWHLQDPTDMNNCNILDSTENVITSARLYFNKFNWAGAVSKILNIENIINDAIGAGSNPRIVRTTCDFLRKCTREELDKLLVIIGWSAVDRNEICVDNPNPMWEMLNVNCKISENRIRMSSHKTERELELDEFHKMYVNVIKNDYAPIHRYFLDQYLLAGLLTGLGVKFLFFNGIPAWWDNHYTKSNIIPRITFAKEIEYQESHNNMLSIDDHFLFFCNSRNLECGPGFHPLWQAHQQWGEYLITKLKERNII